jgi:hypothetical protein
LWTCQRSNSAKFKRSNTEQMCGRASCKAYIELALKQLDPVEFARVRDAVCQQHSPNQEEYATLEQYSSEHINRTMSTGPLHLDPASIALVSHPSPPADLAISNHFS